MLRSKYIKYLLALSILCLPLTAKEKAPYPFAKEAEEHWAFQAVKSVDVPKINNPWQRNAVDRFILKALQGVKLKPSKQASKEKLLRRATYDLIGLPPTIEETNNFLKDSSDKAFEKVVDRLLASKHYGE